MTSWASKQKQRLQQINQTKSTSQWLNDSIRIRDTFFAPRWTLFAAPLLIFITGPQSIGYIVILALIYLFYTQLYLKNKTLSSLWEDYKQIAEQHQKDKKLKSSKTKSKSQRKTK